MACQELCKHDEIKKRSILTKDGNPAQYHLQTETDNLDQSKSYRKITFGERGKNKSHKTILLVGETGAGKTTLINVMVNYMLGVKREDEVWFQITEDQSNLSQAHSQTKIITVYGFYPQESLIDLTIIDTPGYGDTGSTEKDKEISMSLLNLITSAKVDKKIDAVCLVMNSTQNRLTDRLRYIFDAVQSLFGRDIAENIVLLFTHSTGAKPKNALTAVKEAEIKCAVNDKNQPVFFLFNNCQSDTADDDEDDDDDEDKDEQLVKSWNTSFKEMRKFSNFLDTIKPKPLQMTQDVLQKQKQFEAKILNLKSCIEMAELKQNELKQTQAALEQNKKEYEVDVPYKENIPISPDLWYFTKKATCCTVCEENCHYPGCWWVTDLSWCTVMKDDYCTVCTNKCHYSKHVKEAKIYIINKKKEKMTCEKFKKKYEKMGCGEFVMKRAKELQELEKSKLVIEAFHCVETLQMIALNNDSLFVLQHIDFLIEKLKEINETEKAKILENIKKRAGEKKYKIICQYINPQKTEILQPLVGNTQGLSIKT